FGDTCFVSTAAAYDALEPDFQEYLGTLQARHSYMRRYDTVRNDGKSRREPLTEEQRKQVKEVVHPVIRTHPVTGRKCIYVNEGFTTEIIGLSAQESEALLNTLCQHCRSE